MGVIILFIKEVGFKLCSGIWDKLKLLTQIVKLFTKSFDSKESACSAGDSGSVSGSGRSSGEGNGNPLQYSCLENSMDRGA